MKKLLGFILCITMIIGIMPISAFAASAVSKFNITVTEPKEGEKPVYTGSVPETASSYVEKVEWNGELDANGGFKAGVSYTVLVTVRLKANQNKEIKLVKGNSKVNGNEGELYYISDDKQYGVVRYTFAPVVSLESLKPVYDAEGNIVFSDVADDAYYAPAVKWAVKNGITSGTSARTFSPDLTCTKAQILTFLWRASGSPKHETICEFLNVSEADYYYHAIHWASKRNMISGPKFNADEPCTRSTVVFYLWKLAGCPKEYRSYSSKFTDVPNSAYPPEYIGWAVANGITNGMSETEFGTNLTCTRGQIVTFLQRAFK